MSTRKAAAASTATAAIKTENAPATATQATATSAAAINSTTTTTIAASTAAGTATAKAVINPPEITEAPTDVGGSAPSVATDTTDMGANASSCAANVTAVAEEDTVEEVVASEEVVGATTVVTPSKQQQLQLSPNEAKRITRNSPLLTPPANAAAKRADSEPPNSENEDGGGGVASKGRPPAQIRGRKSLKEAKETKDITKDTDEKDDDKKSNSASPEKASKDTLPEEKEGKEEPSTSTPPNRYTRKSAANEIITNTRITRNRQTAGGTGRPETPPAASAQPPPPPTRTRRGIAAAAKKVAVTMPMPIVEPATKRKRSEDETSSTTTTAVCSEPGPKYIKIELKEESAVIAEDSELPPPTTLSDEALKIKQEVVESDESATDASSTSTTVSRGRGRWGTRKQVPAPQTLAPNTAGLITSPSTRSTRHSKVASPSPITVATATAVGAQVTTSSTGATAVSETKRRRVGSTTIAASTVTVTRSSSSSSLLKANIATATSSSIQPGSQTAAGSHGPDEDSKDSMGSSTDDILLAAVGDIKQHISDVEEMDSDEKANQTVTTNEAKATTAATDEDAESDQLPDSSAVNGGLAEPLSVDVEEEESASMAEDATGSGDEATSTKNTTVLETVPGTSSSTAASNVGSSEGSGSEKAASLSPELVSEGVSEISVKQFYKKPKFLENNLGIEQDPKLGEIVQKETSSSAAAPADVKGKTKLESEVAAALEEYEANVNAVAEVTDAIADEEDKEGTIADVEVKEEDELESVAKLSDSDKDTTKVITGQDEDDSDGGKSGAESPSTERHLSPLIIDETGGEECDDQVDEEEDVHMEEEHIIEETVEEDVVCEEEEEEENGAIHEDIVMLDIVHDTQEEDVIETLEEEDDVVEVVIGETEELTDAPEIEAEEEEDEEEDRENLTAEESMGCISMDNNASLPEDAFEGGEEQDDHEEENATAQPDARKVESRQYPVVKTDGEEKPKEEPLSSMARKEKTTKQCDTEKAKLEKPPLPKVQAKKDKDALKVTAAGSSEVAKKVQIAAEIIKEESEDGVAEKSESNITTKEEKPDTTARVDAGENKENLAATTKETITEEAAIKPSTAVAEATTEQKDTKMDEKKIALEQLEQLEQMQRQAKKARLKSVDEAKAKKLEAAEEKMATQVMKNSIVSPARKIPANCRSEDATSSDKIVLAWPALDFDDEKLLQKEQHLQNLGLLTHKAAEQRRQEFIQSSAAAVEASRHTQQQQQQHPAGKRNGKTGSGGGPAVSSEYTGTLKTVIKLNRNGNGGNGASNATNAAGSCSTTITSSNGAAGNGRKGMSSGAGGHSTYSGSSSLKDTQHNSNSGRRQSLKMTFQKGRGRGQGHADRTADQQAHGEDAYYTIQNENEGGQTTKVAAGATAAAATNNEHATIAATTTTTSTTHGRKSHSRSNTTTTTTTTSNNNNNHNNKTSSSTKAGGHDSSQSEGVAGPEPLSAHEALLIGGGGGAAAGIVIQTANANAIGPVLATAHSHAHKKDEREEILIPEKASSFKFHPGRLCEDQCFYCSGKFGLYDTPCHVGQIKSLERQQKILANEEKLTVDNCLCDACFRHVDRRANVPSYKKRLSAPGHLEGGNGGCEDGANGAANDTIDAASTSMDGGGEAQTRKCLVPECANPAAHSLRRKCIRKSVKKFLLNFDVPNSSPYVWLCQTHYDTVIQCSGCVLCKRRLGKNHMYHITSDTDRLEKSLSEMGIPVQLGIGTAVCKLCRYFANLLMKPPDSTKSQKAEFVKNYRKRLLQFHNIHDGSNDVSEADEDDSNGATIAMPAVAEKTPAKRSGNAKAASQRQKQAKLNVGADSPNSKELPSPIGSSSSSSIECLGSEVGKTTTSATGGDPTSTAGDGVEGLEQAQHMLLDNDVLVDYDVPVVSTDSNSSSSQPASPKQMSKLKAILQSASTGSANSSTAAKAAASADISNVLRANPNISMRELFPGEEDLGLHFKAPFGSSSSQRTPEGWTRVQTFLQYDEPTRRLWEELQKPYGNQSSFLRHLILLEKYYRNGDLILSPHASSNATVYTQTVRQRLSSFDQGHCGGLLSGLLGGKAATTTGKPIPTVEINEDESMDVDGERDAVSAENGNAGEDDSGGINLSMQLRSRSVSVDKLTKQLSTNAVTITARPKDPSKPQTDMSPLKSLLKEKEALNTSGGSTCSQSSLNASGGGASNLSGNSRSILKSNLLGINKSVEILPISASAPPSTANGAGNSQGHSLTLSTAGHGGSSSGPVTGAVSENKRQKILEVANKLLVSQTEQAVAAANAAQLKLSGVSLLTSPPELVSLHRRSAGAAAAVAANATTTAAPAAVTPAAAATPSSASPSTSATVSVNNTGSAVAPTNKRPHLTMKPAGGGTATAGAAAGRPMQPNVVILPETLTPQERHQSKSWRPTLMPVEENQGLFNKGGPLYQTADGRRLPALVQVQSGGKPFLISIFDYNRMCILRREKLLRDQMLKSTKSRQAQEQRQQQQAQKNAAAAAHSQQQQQHQQQQQQQHHQQQQHNKNMQLKHQQQQQQQQQHHHQQQQQQQQHVQQQVAQQQLMQLMQMQKQQQHQQQRHQAANKAAAAAAAASARFQPLLPKVSAASAGALSASNITALASNSATSITPTSYPAPMVPLLASAISNVAAAAAANAKSAPAPSSALTHNSWLWNNFPDANQLLLNGGHGSLPQLLPKPGMTANAPSTTMTAKQHQHQQMLLDNALISKIPKSLTVIPQHKLMAAAVAAAAGMNAAGNSGGGGGGIGGGGGNHKE